jgi:enamine deaminase RidA (YjgF/YER057c/UK114 family)
LWHKLRWRFASPAHRDLFAKDPDHYAPQYDGYCAMGISVDDAAHKDTVDPEAWAIVDGKLYLVHNQYWLQVWQEKAEEHIKQANKDWDVVKNLAGPEIVGPPCAAAPPTTKVALRDGGHIVAVGGQLPRDASGKVVGKGDLGAQIEQVGKNVDACLNAGGATVKDIAFTVSYVKQPAEFDKYADLRQRYFGPPSPDSTIVAMPQSAGPDFLVQVEAFAKTQ